MTTEQHSSRRAVLAAAALAGLGVVGSTAFPSTAQAHPARRSAGCQLRFDLDGVPRKLFADARMYGDDYYLQSFSFDTVNRRLFLAQLHQPPTGDPAVDLDIIEMSMSGTVQGRMTLIGFGHGVSIAAVPNDRHTDIWVEVDPNSTGWGSQLARVRYAPGTTIDSSAITPGTDITIFKPVAGVGAFTAAVDPIANHLVVRYNDVTGARGPAHAIRFTVFTLADASAGQFDHPVYDIVQPTLPPGPDGKAPTFQGFTAAGTYLYILDGTAYPGHTPDPMAVNSYLTSVDLRSGTIVQRSKTRAGESLALREPEGMAVDVVPGTGPRLCFGFCTLTEVDSTIRRASIYYDTAATGSLS